MKKLQVFLDKLNQNEVQGFLTENTNEHKTSFLCALRSFLEPFYRRKDDVWYDAEDVNAFCKFMHELHGDGAYLTSWREKMDEILKDARSWRTDKKQQENVFYFLWDIYKKSITNITDQTLAEITERLQQPNPQTYVLVLPPHIDNPYQDKTCIVTFKDASLSRNSNSLPTFSKIEFVKNEAEIQQWIKEHREPLTMNKSNKHGLDGKREHKSNKEDVSKLYCRTIADAQKLLDEAIGDKRLKGGERNLYNYDKIFEKFIIFFYEGDNPQNQYHAFHYETEIEAAQKIPNAIMRELKRKYGLR